MSATSWTGSEAQTAMERLLRRPPWWVVPILAAIVLAPLAGDVSALTTEGRDLVQDYLGARAMLSGGDPYAPFTQVDIEGAGATWGPAIARNVHPPTALALFLPFAVASFAVSAIAWSVASALALVWGWWLATRTVGLAWLAWAAALFGFWFPVELHVRFGQWSILMFLLVVVGWWALRRGDERLGGIAFGIAALVKVFPLVLAIVPLLRRQWRALAWMIGTGAAALGIAALLRPAATRSFMFDVVLERSVQPLDAFGDAGIASFATKMFEGGQFVAPVLDAPWLAGPARIVLTAGVLAIAAVALRRCDDLDLQVSLAIVVMLLVSPVTWVHSFVLLLLPALVLVARPALRRSPALLAPLVVLSALTWVDHWRLGTELRAQHTADPLGPWAHFLSPGFAVLVGFFALLVAVMLRAGSPSVVRPA